MARGITLNRYEVINVDYLWLSAFRLKIVATDAVGLDNEIFLFRRNPQSPYTEEQTDTFITICSPVDMADFPVGAPDPLKTFPFFRAASVELDFRTVEQAEDSWVDIVREVGNLVTALNKLENLTPTLQLRIGDDSDDSDSDSE